MRFAFVSLLTVSALTHFSAFASAEKGQKRYIDPQSVQVTEKGILIKTEKGMSVATMLRSDRRGIFIYPSDIFAGVTKDVWICVDCGYRCGSLEAFESHYSWCPAHQQDRRRRK
jgi:hypothetical protein